MKKSFYVTVVFLISFMLLLFVKKDAIAANITASNTYDGITWTLDDDGTVTFTGSGTIEKDEVLKDKSGLVTDIVIKDGVTAIGDKAFYEFNQLTNISIAESVTSIGDDAFYDCRSLESISIPDSVKKIGNFTFSGCSKLKSVKLSEGISEIGSWVFSYCTELPEIQIPASVEKIGLNAFSCCHALEKVSIPDSVKSIESSAFSRCDGLVNINLPANLSYISENCFYGCSSLKEITIPTSVLKIEHAAFSNCSSLEIVNCNKSLLEKTDIGDVFIYTPWYLFKAGTIEGTTGGTKYTLDKDGTLTLFGSKKYDSTVYYDNSISGYGNYIKTIIFSQELKEIIMLRFVFYMQFPNLEKIINNTDVEILLAPCWDEYSWCNEKDTNERIDSIKKGTAIKVPGDLSKTVKISFDGNGATSGEMEPVYLKDMSESELPECKYTKMGYKFDGWTYYDSTEEELEPIENNKLSFRVLDDEITLHANWKEIKHYTIKFDPNGGSGEMEPIVCNADEDVVIPKNKFTKKGLKFLNWTYNSSTLEDEEAFCLSEEDLTDNNEIVLKAQWWEGYSVSFNSNSGSGEMDTVYLNNYEKYELPDNNFTGPVGKKFDCWWIPNFGNVEYKPGESIETDRNLEILAKWKDKESFEITYDGNGSVGKMPKETIYEGDSYKLPNNSFEPSRGDEFAYWIVNDNDSKHYNAGDIITVNEPITIKAIWKHRNEYKVSVYPNNGTATIIVSNVYEGDSFIFPDNSFEAPKGMTFDYWIINGDNEKHYYPGDKITASESLIVMAIWKEVAKEDQVDNGQKNEHDESIKQTADEKTDNTVETKAETSAATTESIEEKEIVDSKQKTSKIKNAIALKKSITIKWDKKSGNVKGYEIQYSTDKKFSKNIKILTVNKNKTTSKTIKKLLPNTKYYIRIRTFRKKGGKKIYSSWSKTKAIKTK